MKKTLLLLIFLISQTFFSQADCSTALSVCGNSNITYSPTGIGAVNESLGGCLISGEHNSIWYKLTIATSGTLTFNLVPNDPNADYDWAVYGPNVACGSLGSPIRCNAATVIGVGAATGLNMTSTITNAAGGSATPYCQYMDVLAGQTYYLYIDNWVGAGSSTTAPFSLTWGGTATLASPFTDPALQPNPFVPPGIPAANPADPREILICASPAVFDFSTLTAGILNGNSNFVVSYHTSQNDALAGTSPITTPITVNTTTIYYYSIHYQDPTNPNNPINFCRQIGPFKFKQGNITALDKTIFACNNNKAGTATFNLNSANVFSGSNIVIKYYPTMANLNAGTGQIINSTQYVSAPGTVYALVTTSEGCSDIAVITLSFFAEFTVNDAIIRSCSMIQNVSMASFDLSSASVTTHAGTTKKYYKSLADAISGSNEITPSTNYISPGGVVYVKVSDENGCYNIAKITLEVIPPVYSQILKDKIICIEDRTVLDAGAGFDGYEWNTGATTQTISGVGVGTYWVKLKTGECISYQTVKVYASDQPVVTSIDISNTTVTINVNGGKAPYKYSMDNVNWQDSNIFSNIQRGDHVIYVKDSYDCEPISISIVVPNLINVITPNGDGINDFIDYSALSNKANLIFTIFDRYGNKIFQADRQNNYKWDGTSGNKKVPTGNYWYSVSWNENDKKNTPFKYTGWVLVKNRE
ncbi:gliding motility-associated C-terminal domain-containing protein [Chryseobacterium wangxinyae]|uniref:T9SS type B sorting domain-containing protein n=1 Tax=Chryseobacterium sp. CY350 TaxID=2997336 RepID=UPI00226EAB56|nr:T9SS type B sorting domain-containing protein [Chryseobacterium sp. CY350]MCY0977936.1 gliding motility-associated C-terminal domain-containing protein [Chryseobacterium sp. CY350]WBZ95024.1 gliding motility-associated C-terminal domain-containing protein [Chryseobacterium sp. CY350]